jgi:DNA-binding CsgD family transcriptional regulator
VEVVSAIRAVAQGKALCPSRYARMLFDHFALQAKELPNSRTRAELGLTRREQELVPLIDRGMTNKEIASLLNLYEQTVKNHIHRILRKVVAEDRLGIIEAFQTRTLGLLPCTDRCEELHGAGTKTPISVSVPVAFVRCRAQANTRNDNGIRIAANRSRAAIEGHSSRHPAPASSAARTPSSE